MATSQERIHLIKERLNEYLNPSYLEIKDDSHLHAEHEGAKESGGGHFNVYIISKEFNDKSQLDRHRLIYLALGDAMGTEIHALSITALTPEECTQEQNTTRTNETSTSEQQSVDTDK